VRHRLLLIGAVAVIGLSTTAASLGSTGGGAVHQTACGIERWPAKTPPRLHQRLKTMAVEYGRSLNAQIVLSFLAVDEEVSAWASFLN